MSQGERPFTPRPGRVGDRGEGRPARSRSLAAQVRLCSAKAGHMARRPGRGTAMGRKGTGQKGRGRVARLRIQRFAQSRRVIVKARIVRHKGARFRAAPLARHIAYLGREGVTRDGGEAGLFNTEADRVDHDAFASRCQEDRHHFRFIVSPEDAGEMVDLRAFTRELMADVARDLETSLDWVAIDHWNTDNPHLHILVRGRGEDQSDLIIDGAYIAEGIRGRAEERVTLELGLRSEQDMHLARQRDVEAERWTDLDRDLVDMMDERLGMVDLRPGAEGVHDEQRALIGRVTKLARLGLAEQQEPGLWLIHPDAETVLRDLSIRSDIIKTIHRAISADGEVVETGRFALHGDSLEQRVLGRLVERGLQDELTGSAYAIVHGADGQVHHLRFHDLEQTGSAQPGTIVEVRRRVDADGRSREMLATRSELTLAQQIEAQGATWLDRELVAPEGVATGQGFGAEVRVALAKRTDHLERIGLAQRHGNGVSFDRDLIDKLRDREMDGEIAAITKRTGMPHSPAAQGEHVSGLCRERVTLSSGRFALVETIRDDGSLGFQLVPWRPAFDSQLGQQINGVMGRGGQIEWTIGRGRGLGV